MPWDLTQLRCESCERPVGTPQDLRPVTFADFRGRGSLGFEPQCAAGSLWVCGGCESELRALSELTLGQAWVALGQAVRAQDDLPAPFNQPGPSILAGDVRIDVGIQRRRGLQVSLVRHIRDGYGPVVLGLDVDEGVSVSLDEQTVVLAGTPTGEVNLVQWLLTSVPHAGHCHVECGCQQDDARFDEVFADTEFPGIVALLDRLPRPDRASDYVEPWYLPAGGAWLWRGRTGHDGRAVVERVAEDDQAKLLVLGEVSVELPRGRHWQ